MLHSSLNWEEGFQEGFYGFEKFIWKSFLKSWRLSWKKLLLGAFKPNWLPRLSPRAAKMPPQFSITCRVAQGLVSVGREVLYKTGQQNSSLIRCGFQCSSKCFRQMGQIVMDIVDVLTIHPSPPDIKGFGWGYHTPGVSPRSALLDEKFLWNLRQGYAKGFSSSSCWSYFSGKIFNLIPFNSGYKKIIGQDWQISSSFFN